MSRRRVSYVIPPAQGSIPRLKLPPLGVSRNGRPSPILVHSEEKLYTNRGAGHPRHRLGVSAFALDTTTQLTGRPTPEGILYTAGRDGMIISWDLGVPLKRRTHRWGTYSIVRSGRGRSRSGRWERLTRDEEDGDPIYEEDDSDEEDWPTSDGDVIGDVKESGGRHGAKYWSRPSDIPFEEQWETDLDLFDEKQPTHIRQSTQAHTDWINDILLCNNNQTVVSCSSDGTIKAWNPHTSPTSRPSSIGTHSDYVRCLAKSRDRNWIASGSFDRTIKIWDISQPTGQPVATLLPPDAPGPKCSVYALAADPTGRLIASGGPERVVRTWDPRAGKRVGKLVGHTDNIRAMVMSEDSRYLLTGSADASIKLWSLASPQRCIYTFTHHIDSVWSLFSSHPSLETFYSSDRAGYVCRVDVEHADRISEGECVVLCRDKGDKGEQGFATSDGVSGVIVMDDNLMWTASGSSSIRRWKIPQRRVTRAVSAVSSPEELSPRSPVAQSFFPPTPTSPNHPHRPRGVSTAPSITASLISSQSSIMDNADAFENTLHGIPYDSLVRLTMPNAPHLHGFSSSRIRDSDVATLYSAASIMSVPRQVRSPVSGTYQHRPTHTPSNSLVPPPPDYPVPLTSRQAYEERDVAPDATPFATEPNEAIPGEHGLVRAMIMNDRMHALTVNTAGVIAVWDIVRAQCLGIFTRDDVRISGSGTSESDGTAANGQAEKNMEFSPRQALETVRERIEGEAVVPHWSSADTKIGELMITLSDRWFESEIFADETGYGPERPFTDEQRLNIGKWVLRNLFNEFIREEAKSTSALSSHSGTAPPSSFKHPKALSETAAETRLAEPNAQDVTPRSPRANTVKVQALSPIAQSPATSIGCSDAPTPRPVMRSIGTPVVADNVSTTLHPGTTPTPVISPSAGAKPAASTNTNKESQDYFSYPTRRRPTTGQSISGQTAGQTTPDDFSGWGGPGNAKQGTQEVDPAGPSTPGGRLMGRLKSFGKSTVTRRAATEVETPSANPTSSDLSEGESAEPPNASPPLTLAQRLKSQGLKIPPMSEAPPLPIPLNVDIVVSEESPSGWAPLYRGPISNAGADAATLEVILPDWLLEYLLVNKAPAAPISKVSFVLLPLPIPPASQAEYGNTLPELVNSSQTKLSASRFLRVKKLTYHVQDKLEKLRNAQLSSPRLSSDTGSSSPFRPATPRSADGSAPNASLEHSSSDPSIHSMHSQAEGRKAEKKAEDLFEILCNDQVLPIDMTLAAVRQFVWRQAAELVLHYRRKAGTVSSTSTPVSY